VGSIQEAADLVQKKGLYKGKYYTNLDLISNFKKYYGGKLNIKM